MERKKGKPPKSTEYVVNNTTYKRILKQIRHINCCKKYSKKARKSIDFSGAVWYPKDVERQK